MSPNLLSSSLVDRTTSRTEDGAEPHRREVEPSLRLPWAIAAAVAAGVLTYLAFPPVGLWPLAPAGVALLIVAAAGHRARTASLLGAIFSLAFFGLLVRWLIPNIGWLPWVALTVAESLLLAVLVAPLPLLLRLPARPLVVAVWWTATESVRSRFPLGGFPWGRLAFSQAESPALAWAQIAGAPAVTFVVALVAGSLAALALAPTARARLLRCGWAAASLGLAVALAGPPAASSSAGSSAVIALIQGNVPRERSLAEQARVRNITRNHAQATEQLAREVQSGKVPRPDLVVWPENSTDSDPRTDPLLRRVIDRAVSAVDAPILVGAILKDGGLTYNAGLMWRPESGPGQWYAKRRLVPFGEYIPARDLLGSFGKLQLIPRDFTPGTKNTVFTAGEVRVADVICYEIGFDGLVRSGVRAGANVLVEQTNDATFIRDDSTGEPEQQLAMARLRAVEHDRSVIVASTTGVSAVVRPDGTVARRTGIWERAVVTARVPLNDSLTPADRLTVWPEVAIGAAAFALLVLGMRYRQRTITAAVRSR